MLRALLSTASRFLDEWNRKLLRERRPAPELLHSPGQAKFQPIERLVLTDEVCRTLFEDYAEHRRGFRGDEEIGWILLGRREGREVLALATLPAGADRQAGVAHVRFNSNAQALASRIVRQEDKRLRMIGVVHTHPGSLRHPSDGDYRGDILWVGQLRGGEGVFGIGTADEKAENDIAHQPEAHRQILGELGFSWYVLGQGDKRYRKLPVTVTIGPDLARPLHPLWTVIEEFAAPLERLCRQQAMVRFATTSAPKNHLIAEVPLAEPGSSLRIVLAPGEKRFFVAHNEELFGVEAESALLDRAVYLILAELAESGSKDWYAAPSRSSEMRTREKIA